MLRPKRFEDIQKKRGMVFSSTPPRLNLSYVRAWTIPVSGIVRFAIAAGAMWFLILGSVIAPTTPTHAADNSSSEQERQALESQLKDLENQINQYEGQITSYKKQGKTLSGEIASLNGKVAKLNLQIQAINLTLKELDQKIVDTQYQINSTETSIDSNKGALGDLIKNLYQSDQASLVEIFLRNPKLSDFFTDMNSMTILQNKLRITIGQISSLKDQLEEQKNQFALARADAATIKEYQNAQKVEADQTKKQKNELLAATKGQESKYQALLTQTKETAAQIRNRIFQLLGGGELSFEQAYEYAKLASSATGVRAALILAVLDRESALGKNVGRCSYQTAMSLKNQTLYLAIVKELNLNPDTLYVSCPNSDGVYGGAMGPAQFVPSTWNLYKDQVAKITGHSPASPWNNADAFIATALYLRDAGAVADSVPKERIAAARYYAGGNWSRYLWTYGEAVVGRARQFQQDIDTITG